MSLRDSTFIVSGIIQESDFINQQVTVLTFQGETYYNVPVFSQYLSASNQTGFHSFPKEGDFCKLTQDTDRWYVSAFIPFFDPTGAFITTRPPRYRAGSVHMSTDLSTVDVLPSIAGSNPVVFATQKYGITEEDPIYGTDFCTVPASSTTLSNAPAFDLFSVLRRKFPTGTCDEIVGPKSTDTQPSVVRMDIGAILVDTAVGTVTNKTITLFFDSAVDVFKNGLFVEQTPPTPNTPGVKLVIPGLDTALYSLLTIPAYDSGSNTISGPATIQIRVSNALPSGVYDITFLNTANGTSVTAFGGLSIRSFTAGNFRKTYFVTPPTLSLGFSDESVITGSSNPENVGVMFTVNSNVSSTILQEKDTSNLTVDNSTYLGISGPFPDFVSAFDVNGEDRVSETGFSFGTCSEVIPDPGPFTGFDITTLKATVTGVNLDPVQATAIGVRLQASAVAREVFPADPTRHNVGVQLSNFESDDTFRVTIYRDIPKVAPNYDLDPRLDYFTPSSFYAPVSEIQLQLTGENIRFGSGYALIRNTELVGTEYVPITGDKAAIPLGFDTTGAAGGLAFVNIDGTTPALGGEQISGTGLVTRVSDQTVGFTLTITSFNNSNSAKTPPYGDYDLHVFHESQPTSIVVLPLAIRITPPPTNSSTGNISASISSNNNVVLQEVKARPTTGADVTRFSYAVDEQGRCDITAAGGFYVNGRALSGGSNSFVGSIGRSAQAIDFATELGDGSLITDDGSIFIAAYRKNDSDDTKGNVHIHAQNCFSAGQDANECFVGRRALTAQFGTLAPEAHLGGLAKPMLDKFPITVGTALVIPDGTSLSSVGPLLVPDEGYEFTGQPSAEVTPAGGHNVTAHISTTNTGFAGARFALRSRATLPSGYLIEGNIELIFVPDGNGEGTDDKPFTGSWHIPLA